MRTKIYVFALCMLLVIRAEAGVLPNYSGAVNAAVGKSIQQAAIRRGFAANDPRFAATFGSAGTVVAGVAADAAGAALTAASAPVWLSIAGALGAAAVVGGLAYGIYKVFFDDSSSQAKFYVQSPSGDVPYGTVGVPSGSPNYTQAGLSVDQKYRLVGSTNARIPQVPIVAVGLALYCDSPDNCMALAKQAWESVKDGSQWNNQGCDAEDVNGNVLCHAQRVGSGGIAQGNTWINTTVNIQMINNPLVQGQTIKGDINSIVVALPDSELAKDADPATVAVIANNVWQQAASQPNYQGIPYSASDPVTASDAVAVQQAAPASWPKNADLVSPVSTGAGVQPSVDPATATQPATNPSTGTGTNPSPTGTQNVAVVNTPGVNVMNKVQIDFGQYPTDSAPPNIGDAPTGSSILAPIVGAMPGLKHFVVPSHDAQCPKPEFKLFDKDIVMDSHCTLMEGIRPQLFAIMAAVWALLAVLIILTA